MMRTRLAAFAKVGRLQRVRFDRGFNQYGGLDPRILN
jgi:hypothetical protein